MASRRMADSELKGTGIHRGLRQAGGAETGAARQQIYFSCLFNIKRVLSSWLSFTVTRRSTPTDPHESGFCFWSSPRSLDKLMDVITESSEYAEAGHLEAKQTKLGHKALKVLSVLSPQTQTSDRLFKINQFRYSDP